MVWRDKGIHGMGRIRNKRREEESVTKRLMKWISPLVAMATAVVDEWFSVQFGGCKE